YPVMTTSGAVGRCIAADAGGEAFEFVTADGMVYTMDHLVAAPTSSLRKSSEMPDLFGMGGQAAMTAYQATGSPGMQPMTAVDYLLPRAEVFLFPTKIADRHGNEVSYVWSETNPWQLLRIEGDDGRQIDITYTDSTGHRIASVTDGSRTWSYGEIPGTSSGLTVARPDGSGWVYDLSDLARAKPNPLGVMCDDIVDPAPGTDSWTGS